MIVVIRTTLQSAALGALFGAIVGALTTVAYMASWYLAGNRRDLDTYLGAAFFTVPMGAAWFAVAATALFAIIGATFGMARLLSRGRIAGGPIGYALASGGIAYFALTTFAAKLAAGYPLGSEAASTPDRLITLGLAPSIVTGLLVGWRMLLH